MPPRTTNNSRHAWKLGGAILAGGRARRLDGIAKGLIPHDRGDSIVQRLFDQMIRAGVEQTVIASADIEAYRSLGHDIVADRRHDAGPLAGIEAALDHLSPQCNATIILPCDVPAVSTTEIRRLIDALLESDAQVVYARTDHHFGHPLCAAVDNRILPEITAALDMSEHRPRKVWTRVAHLPVQFPDESIFRNLNTKEDLLRWQQGSF